MRMIDISTQNRPRERMLKKGPDVLSDAELLAVVLQKGTKRSNVVNLAQKILGKYSLENLQDLSVNQLKAIAGIGEAKALQVIALAEIGKRLNSAKKQKKRIKKPQDVYEHMKENVKNLKQEHFFVLSLDTKNKILAEKIIAIGTLNAALLHPREIFKEAIKNSANSIIIVHNHPTGDPEPSNEDIKITEDIMKAAELIGINVLDHIILGDSSYWSYKES
ncbi:MAG: RadC family protein [Candidatus Nanoarchaeia archaeon]